MNRTLAPGGCLNIAFGSIDASAGPVNFTLGSVPVLIDATVSNGTTTFTFPDFTSTLTVMHFWSNNFSNASLSQFSNTPCTVPTYLSPQDLGSALMKPSDWNIPTVDIQNGKVSYSVSVRYRVGCPSYPNQSGRMDYFVQLWGQSNYVQDDHATNHWKQIPFALPFPNQGFFLIIDCRFGLYAVIGPKNTTFEGRIDGKLDAQLALTCPVPIASPTTAVSTKFITTSGSWTSPLARNLITVMFCVFFIHL
ncbi:hypothetical protein BDR26DRAFT_917481 [Obelidium mucronatum]|nr:hypothetical protein BDR26DRAFT_917481 [Obelidium mucronatum]